jgi:hypothetical protein
MAGHRIVLAGIVHVVVPAKAFENGLRDCPTRP